MMDINELKNKFFDSIEVLKEIGETFYDYVHCVKIETWR